MKREVIGVPSGLKPRSGVVCVAALTEQRYDVVLDAFKDLRRAAGKSIAIKSTTQDEVLAVLDRFGFQAVPLPVNWKDERPTYAAWLKTRIDWVRNRKVLLQNSGEFAVAYYKGVFDEKNLKFAWARDAAGRRRLVEAAWIIAPKGATIEVPNQVVEAVTKKLVEEPKALPPGFVEARKLRQQTIAKAKALGLTLRESRGRQIDDHCVAVDAPKGKVMIDWNTNRITSSMARYGRQRWKEMSAELDRITPDQIVTRP